MAKNNKKNGGFKNTLAEYLKESHRVILLDESQIYRKMDEDFDEVLKQMSAHLNGEHAGLAPQDVPDVTDGKQKNEKKRFVKKGKMPQYFLNIFHNVSFLRYIKEWLDENDDASKTDLKSVSVILAMGFKDSRMYPEVDKELREEMILKLFYRINRKKVKKVRNLVKNKSRAIEIAMYTMLQPLYAARNVVTLLEKHSRDSNRDKIKLLKSLYGDRYSEFVGYCMCNQFSGNVLLDKIVKRAMNDSKTKRSEHFRNYARAFKKMLQYHRTVAKKAKKKKNKKIIKNLIFDDLGFKKAFRFGKKLKKKELNELKFISINKPAEQYYNSNNNNNHHRNDNRNDRRNGGKHHDSGFKR